MFKKVTILSILCCTSVLVAAVDPCDLPEFCTPSQVLECAQSVKFNDSYYKEVIDDIVKSIEPYVYLDILKNPPQPEGFTDYFKPVDIVSELKAVKTEGVAFYDFYREVKKILMSPHDGHFYFEFPGNKNYDNRLSQFVFILPIVLKTTRNNLGVPMMKGLTLDYKNLGLFYEKFDKGLEVKAVIEKNADIGIVSINDMDPFEYVLNLGSEYYNSLKNENARYTYAEKFINGHLILYFPLTLEDFTNFTVVYENGETFTSDFYFYNVKPITRKRNNDDIIETIREKIKNKPYDAPFCLEDILKVLDYDEEPRRNLTEKEVGDSLKDNKYSTNAPKVSATATKGISWDYETKDGILKCKADKINEVNVYIITSFIGDTNNFIDVLKKCVYLFDNNTYPIIAVTDNNPGGSILLSYIFQECVQPDMVSRTYFSFKTDNITRKELETFVKGKQCANPDTCKKYKTVDEIMEDPITDNYGNGVTHTRTRPVLLAYDAARQTLDTIKPNLTNRRKPTEIVVFTDSYSYSASSIFTKGMRESGAAIIIGYNGYPGSSKETFDIGQSPTNVLDNKTLINIIPTEYDRLYKKGIIYNLMSFGESFRLEDYDSKKISPIPREFLVDVADGRMAFYDSYDDNYYSDFVTMAKQAVKRFKVECNPNNTKLHLRSEKCDSVIKKDHMHGGYTCGADGIWSTICEGYYCDDGYYFDTYTKECVADPCSSNSFSRSLSINTLIMLFIMLVMV